MFFFKKNYQSIKSSEIENLGKNLIDVRTKQEYESGHIPKARNIEMTEIIANPTAFLQKDENYYIICASGMRSARVCKTLSKLGYTVTNVTGGMMSYSGKRI